MSLEDAASLIAEHLQRQDFVEVYAHHDADGISAAAIICIAMIRRDGHFRLRIRQRVSPAELGGDAAVLLCDIGSSMEHLPAETMVIDHHHPHFNGRYHINPRHHGMNGDLELSASGAAYLVAQQMGENRDLAGLAFLGIIGDRQEFTGKNLEIYNEALAEGVISTGRGVRMPGRNDHERLISAINPYLHQISGDEPAVAGILTHAQGENGIDQATLISYIILGIGPSSTIEAMESIYGDQYLLDREVIRDAHTFAAVVDACGKSGHGGLAASLCLRSAAGIEEAWERAVDHRLNVIEAIRSVTTYADTPGFFQVADPSVSSDVADALAFDCEQERPVAVFARSGDLCHVSARATKGIEIDIGSIMREIALSCGGLGGGHGKRAGATIGCGEMERFRNDLYRMVTV
jgi:single-stranded-DNA-specific exonuclease